MRLIFSFIIIFQLAAIWPEGALAQEVNVKKFGARGNGRTDDTKAVQNAINSGAKVVYFPKGVYPITKCLLRSNIQLKGTSGAVIKSLDIRGASPMNGTFELISSRNAEYRNITISDLTFKGTPPYRYNTLPVTIYFFAGGNAVFRNLIFENLTFYDVSHNGILLIANQAKVGFDNVLVDKCRGYGSGDPKKYLVGNLIRVINNSDRRTNYGVIIAKSITVRNSYAKNIRTLADIKRGCSDVILRNNITYNMHDCHLSIDGSFNCRVENNIATMDKRFLKDSALTGSNFLEVQGEKIQIRGNKAVNFKNQGIFISDYSYPEEKGNNHTSRDILIENNQIFGVSNTGIKILNAQDVTISNNTIVNSGVWDIVVDSNAKNVRSEDRKNKKGANNIIMRNNKISGRGIVDNIHKTILKDNKTLIELKK